MVAIPFGTISSPGEKGALSGSLLKNCILEQSQAGQIIYKRAPGLTRLATSIGGRSHCRGMIAGNSNVLLVCYDDHVESATYSGGVTTNAVRGPLSGTDLVTLARNNAATPDIVGVSPANGAFVLTVSGAPAGYPDADVGSPNSVCFLDGYFFFTYGDGSCIASDLNSTAINPLNSVKAESSPDGLLRGVAFRGLLFLCSPSTIEVWQDTANPTGFPFSRSTVIPRGLIAANAIAGWESRFASSLMWVGPDNIVYMLRGYEPVRVSTHDVEHDIQALADKTTLRAFVFINNGHPFWCLKSAAFTWVYDLLTSTWQERESYGQRSWRAEQSVFMWNDWVLGDEATGYLFRPDNLAYVEDTSPLVWDITSLPTDKFPARFTVSRADFDFVAGVGIAAGDPSTSGDPNVLISWSDDGGASFSMPLTRKLGKQGEYAKRITLLRAGQATSYGRQWRLQVSDAVFVGFVGGDMLAIIGGA